MQRLWFVLAFLICAPALVVVGQGLHAAPTLEALLFGGAILGAAFILSWAAEVAQMDISQALAIAILALIAVLPEYAIDLFFAWRAAEDPQYTHYAAANMTGANRLLVGFGWPVVFFLFMVRFRKRSLHLEKHHRVEIFFLALATLYSFTIPFKKTISLVDSGVLLTLFGLYAWRISRAEVHEPELVGPARLIGSLPRTARRLVTMLLFAFSATVIFGSAERFAEALVHSGKDLGIDEFLLVQWVAPLASEAPEFIVAALWALRGQATAGLGALISSKVNQWTLLIGTLPIAYSINLGEMGALHLDERQTHEIWLTACQSLFAVSVIANLRFSWYGALLLFGLFASQLVFQHIRMQVAVVYLVLALLVFGRDSTSRLRSLRSRGVKES